MWSGKYFIVEDKLKLFWDFWFNDQCTLINVSTCMIFGLMINVSTCMILFNKKFGWKMFCYFYLASLSCWSDVLSVHLFPVQVPIIFQESPIVNITGK